MIWVSSSCINSLCKLLQQLQCSESCNKMRREDLQQSTRTNRNLMKQLTLMVATGVGNSWIPQYLRLQKSECLKFKPERNSNMWRQHMPRWLQPHSGEATATLPLTLGLATPNAVIHTPTVLHSPSEQEFIAVHATPM